MRMIELGSALSRFFDPDVAGPSHDQISTAFQRFDVVAGDPRTTSTESVGKVKRVREVYIYIQDRKPEVGLPLTKHFVALLRSLGAFIPNGAGCAGPMRVAALQRVVEDCGLHLSPDGSIRPIVIDNLAGSELTEALQSYVNRANLNPDDEALQVGNGKDLDEAAARHVLKECLDMDAAGANFPTTLRNAFSVLGLAVAPEKTRETLDRDPHLAVQQCLYQLGCAVNRLRNEVGTGHGRPSPSTRTRPLTAAEARTVARASALVVGMLMDNLSTYSSQVVAR